MYFDYSVDDGVQVDVQHQSLLLRYLLERSRMMIQTTVGPAFPRGPRRLIRTRRDHQNGDRLRRRAG